MSKSYSFKNHTFQIRPIDCINVFMKKFDTRGLSAPAPGYIHVYDHHFQRSFSLNRLANQSQILRGASLGTGKANTYIYRNCPGHVTKMATKPIYGKNLQKSSPIELIVL